jgi:hypothetical protein
LFINAALNLSKGTDIGDWVAKLLKADPLFYGYPNGFYPSRVVTYR